MKDPATFIAVMGIAFLLWAVALAILAALSAVLLRLAIWALRLGEVTFGRAYWAALLALFVVSAMNFAITLPLESMHSSIEPQAPRAAELRFHLTPSLFLQATALGLVLTATIFMRFVPPGIDDERMTFSAAFGLAALHFAFLAVLGFGLVVVFSVLALALK